MISTDLRKRLSTDYTDLHRLFKLIILNVSMNYERDYPQITQIYTDYLKYVYE